MGLGTLEVIVILMVAIAIFGPQRMSEIGRSVGKAVREFKKVSADFTKTITEEGSQVGNPVHEIKKMSSDFTKTISGEVSPKEEAGRDQEPGPEDKGRQLGARD